MLIKGSHSSSLESMYQCDRCSILVDHINRKAIYISFEKSAPKKKWDLCDTCYKMLCKGISKGVKTKTKEE